MRPRAITVGFLLIPTLSCSTPSSPSVAVPATGPGEVHGQLIERYSPTGVPNGAIYVIDGRDMGLNTRTDAEGRFVLRGLHQKRFSIFAGAEGFVAVYTEVGIQDLTHFPLAPSVVEDKWSGTFPKPGLDFFNERIVPFTTGHNGPIVLAFTAGCSTVSGENDPLGIFVFRSSDSATPVTSALFGSSSREYSVERVLPADKYIARFTFRNQNRGGCPWSMAIRYPK